LNIALWIVAGPLAVGSLAGGALKLILPNAHLCRSPALGRDDAGEHRAVDNPVVRSPGLAEAQVSIFDPLVLRAAVVPCGIRGQVPLIWR
jgi:hypothetical protein